MRYREWKPYITFWVFSVMLVSYYWVFPSWVDRNGSIVVQLYMVMDLLAQPKMSMIYQVHHLCAICLCFHDVVTKDRESEMNKAFRRLYFDTEWSTLVLCLYQIFRRDFLLMIFVCVFIYMRIFSILYVYHEYVDKFEWIRDVPSYTLYLLNTHWLFEIMDRFKVSSMWIEFMILYYQVFLIIIQSRDWGLLSIVLGILECQYIMLILSFLTNKLLIFMIPQLYFHFWKLKKNSHKQNEF